MIKVYDTVSGQTLIFPMLPEKITFEAGTNFLSYDLMNIGEVKIPSGEILSSISWDGVLPSGKTARASYVSNWRDPSEIQSQFSIWRAYGRKLRLTIDGTPINHGVYLDTYKVDYEGGMGDYSYSISFVVAKDIAVGLTSSTTKTYVTVPGDTLWSIAQKTTGSGSNYNNVKKETKADNKTGEVQAGTQVTVSATEKLRQAAEARLGISNAKVGGGGGGKAISVKAWVE